MDEAGLYLVNDPDYMLSVCVRLCDRGGHKIQQWSASPHSQRKEKGERRWREGDESISHSHVRGRGTGDGGGVSSNLSERFCCCAAPS